MKIPVGPLDHPEYLPELEREDPRKVVHHSLAELALEAGRCRVHGAVLVVYYASRDTVVTDVDHLKRNFYFYIAV